MDANNDFRSDMRASRAFVCVEVCVDGKRAGGHGTFMKVTVDGTTCKDLLLYFLQSYASEYYPLSASSNVVLMRAKISDTMQGRPAIYVG